MEKFVPYEKMSKRTRRELDRQRRGSWGAISPVSRKVESKKVYNRKKMQPRNDFETASFISLRNYAAIFFLSLRR